MARRDDKLLCTKEPYIEDIGPRKIKSIKFSTFSGPEIEKVAEVQVWNGRLYGEKMKPVENGLLDLRMGPGNKAGSCATCYGSFTDCPGHFGYLKLTLPVFNVGYFTTILNILKCICKSCARVILPEKERLEYLKKMRNPKIEIPQKVLYFKKIRDRCKSSRCLRCGYVNGIAKKARSSLAIIEDFAKNWDASGKEVKAALSHIKEKMNSIHPLHVLSPNKVLDLFRRMVDEDCELLCLSDRPEKLIITDIPVPPAGIRPSVFVDFGKSSNEDGITSILKNIVNTNSILREDLENSAATHKCLECWDVLQVQVAEFINSEHSCVPDSKNRGFVQRLKGKHGRFRANLSGKRVEFTGRTVISPDPNLKITEVAIPILMARILTYPERVSQHNIEKLRQCIKNGPFKYPGANYVSLPDGTRLHLKYVERKNVANELKCGYVVERHLENGDIVLFNRQPSLHRMSIMSHRARIMNWRTLRFNESVCNPYNADFDGDEMNMHVPQTEEARTEALMLMGVQNNLCTPKNGEILVASTQDFLTSSFLITRKDTFYDRASFSLICSYMGDSMEHIDLPTPSIIKPLELWTGKQIFSVLVRPNAQTRVFLNLKNPEKGYKSGESMDLDDRFVYFRNSELLSGQIGKSTIGNGSTKGLFSILIRDYGAHAAASCMNRLAKLSARWIGNHGFSIGIDDVTPGEQLNNKRKDAIEKGYEKCNDLILKYNKGDLPLQPGCDAAQTLEALISGVLNKIREDVGKVCMTELHWRNSPLIMSQCGSKGSPINISQMIACVGQQSVGGRRAPDGFIGRTLPHFHRNSKTPSAKGFVANSFYCGLTATEFFFHTMGGREGLVDTAVKTADTGYMSRRLIKTLEDLSTYYDQTVRTASGAIIQFVYGEDGLDPAKMEGKDGIAIDFDHMFGKVMATCPSMSKLSTTDIQHATLSPSDVENAKLSPSEVEQIALDICSKADKIPRSFKQKISDYVETIARALMINKQSVEEGSKKDENIVERTNGRINGISRKQLQLFLEMCFLRYHSKEIEPGAAVGAIGAQSIGEPGTQMTLKTFHFAGVASMNVTLGVPRIKEILDASKNISTPIITATLEHEKDVNIARVVKGSIEKTLLGEVSKGIKVVLKSSQPYISVVLDMDLIEALFMGISSYSVKQSILDDAKIKKCKLKNEHIQTSTICKLKITIPGEKDIQTELRTLQSILPKVIVKGIPSVERAIISTEGGNYKLFIEGTPRGADMGTLRAVMGIPGIKGTETKSNHIIEIQHTLGIEAARKCIIDEIKYTISQYGMNIDIRHMMLLADVMTCKGEVLGTTRYGLKKMKDSVLMLASFEKTEEHLFNASINGREDQIEGVSECIIMGTPMQFGTGILKVIQRVDQLPELKYGADPIFSR